MQLMDRFDQRLRGICLIAAVYVYFLIYAQFGFLHRLREAFPESSWNPVLGVMCVAGLIGALYAAVKFEASRGRRWLLISFIGAAVGASLTIVGTYLAVFFLSAFISGFSLAVLTVSLIGVLANELPVKGIGVVCGLGTGIAYLLSNVPFVFNALPRSQCIWTLLACVFGVYLTQGLPKTIADSKERISVCPKDATKSDIRQLMGLVLVFLILIWSDSAAFTRIQETPDLKAASWSGAGALWSIGLLHFLAAIVGGWLMDCKFAGLLYVLALAGLAYGLYGLETNQSGLFPVWIYAGAVSLYSTALVAVALVDRKGLRPTLIAGVIFGISGWIGSAMGIGMVQDLGSVPRGYWIAASFFMLPGLWLLKRKETV